MPWHSTVWDEMGWNGMEWDGIRGEGTGLDGMEWDELRCDGMSLGGVGQNMAQAKGPKHFTKPEAGLQDTILTLFLPPSIVPRLLFVERERELRKSLAEAPHSCFEQNYLKS